MNNTTPNLPLIMWLIGNDDIARRDAPCSARIGIPYKPLTGVCSYHDIISYKKIAEA